MKLPDEADRAFRRYSHAESPTIHSAYRREPPDPFRALKWLCGDGVVVGGLLAMGAIVGVTLWFCR